MKENVVRILKNYGKAFLPTKNYLVKELVSLEAPVMKKIAIVNCRRIVAVAPFFLILHVANLMYLMNLNEPKFLTEAWIISVLSGVIIVVASVVIIWIMFLNKVDNMQEIWKFKMIYRIFWCTWFVLATAMSFIQIQNGFGGMCFTFSCIIVSLLFMPSIQEFLVFINSGSICIDFYKQYGRDDVVKQNDNSGDCYNPVVGMSGTAFASIVVGFERVFTYGGVC